MSAKFFQKLLISCFTGVFIVVLFVGIVRYRNSSHTSGAVPIGNQQNPQSPGVQSSQGSKDGFFTGQTFDTRYGNVAVSIAIKNGKITSVDTPTYPSSPPSVAAKPILIAQAISANSANIQGVSGATITSNAFRKSLENALSQINGAAGSGANQNLTPSIPQAQLKNPFFEEED